MRPASLLIVAAAAAVTWCSPASAADPTRRFAIVAGARDGGEGRLKLRYATTDAQDVANVLRELGGVARADVALLEDPTPAELRAALSRVSADAAALRARGTRSEVLLYYSGHSDADGLLLGGARFAYSDLRAELDRIPAEVRVAILDSCASGAFTRSKGGVRRPPFLLDASSRLRGHAFLTSSAADEASQESDRLRASFFTHALLGGLRGAADANGDARVTLNEAYQFAFHETLARTETTQAGPQHATYDIGLVGSGDVVLTDLRLAGATLVVPEALAGRVFVRDGSGVLVVELRKAEGTTVELALPEGPYQVRVAHGQKVEEGTFRVPGSGRVLVAPTDLSPVTAEATTSRGDAAEAGPETPRPLRRVPVDISIVPPLSLNDSGGRPAINRLALAIFVGSSEVVDGLALASLGHKAGRLRGAQLAGVAALAGEQVGGAQLAGVFARAGAVEGAQLAGVAGLSGGRVEGAQLAGVFAQAGSVEGIQMAPVTVAGPVTGAQIGVLNVGGRVHGTQIGVVNVADDVDVPIGVLNLIRQGRQHLEVFATETNAFNLTVRLGSRRFHTVLTAGIDPREREGRTRWTTGYGLGVHFALSPRLSLDLDALVQDVQYGAWDDASHARTIATLRPTFAWQLARRAALIGGPSANLFVSDEEHGDVEFLRSWDLGSGRKVVRLFPGFALGLRV
jgi:hypothetical protein